MDFVYLQGKTFKLIDSGAGLPNDLPDNLRWSYLSSGNIAWSTNTDITNIFEFPVASNKNFVEISQVRLYATLYDIGGTMLYDVTAWTKFSAALVQNSNSSVIFFGNDNGQPLNLILNKATNGTVSLTSLLLAGDLNQQGFAPAAGSYVTTRIAILYK